MIPIDLPPQPWEQLGGYFLRVTEVFSSVRALMQSGRRWSSLPFPNDLHGLSGLPSDDVVEAVGFLFAMEPDQIKQMTMWRFPGGLFGGPGVAGSAGTATAAPSLIDGGVFCASCVLGGHWDLRWRTGLIFACTRHLEYVHTRCPRCGGLVTPETVRFAAGTRGVALGHGTSATRACRLALRPRAGIVSSAHLTTQAALMKLIDAACEVGSAASACRDVLRWAEWLHRGRGGASALITGGFINADAEDLGNLMAAAHTLYALSPAAAAEHSEVRHAVLRQHVVGPRPSRPPMFDPYGSGPDKVAAAHRLAVATAGQPVAPPAKHACGGRTHLPQVVPISEITPDVFDALGLVPLDRARVLAAVCAAMPPDPAAWRDTAKALRLPVAIGAQAGHLAAYFEYMGADGPFWSAISRTRERIADRHIDFAERAARVLNDGSVVAAATTTWPAFATEPITAVRQWLLERWACQYIATLPGELAGRRNASPDSRDRLDRHVAGTIPVAEVWRRWPHDEGEIPP
ncbi:hypothetical protein [Cellulomonas sp. Leaf334]|uniref:hypothetical protein n=1 Tax=Cellulomonas sp. Leaf334 TaxID=1736339 RepID=UPI000B0CAD2E|nr:hypothetical protein [Cellulomonas sp. Leaf334]